MLEGVDRAFFADGAGNKKIGLVGTAAAGDLEGGQAVEAGESEVGEDDVEAAAGQGRLIVRPVLDPHDLAVRPRLCQEVLNQSAVIGRIFEMEDTHGISCASARCQGAADYGSPKKYPAA